ncbi:MAG: T9SS type A sorting domain-containing protein [Bacteroidia bacterium]
MNKKKAVIVLFLSILTCERLAAQIVYTVSGFVFDSYAHGDGGPAKLAWVDLPEAVAVDDSGNVYISDTGDNLIRKVGVNSVITTIAGTGNPGYSGDGGPALAAEMNSPGSICVDTMRNVYFYDPYSAVIRKINASTGIISKVVGTGTVGYSGDNGPATSAQFSGSMISVDRAGNLYIADFSRIRKVNTAGIITTIAGNGTAGYTGDNGLAISAEICAGYVGCDSSGNFYLLNAVNSNVNVIRKINKAGIITTIAGTSTASGWSGDGGPAISAGIGETFGMSVDRAGNVYLSDAKFIRKISAATGIMDKIAGTGVTLCGFDATPALSTGMNPYGLFTDNLNNVYYADHSNNKVRVLCVTNCIAGVEELSDAKKIAVYPNPATSILHVDDLSIPENSQIEVTNALGQTILKLPFSNTIDVSDLTQGVYSLKITSRDGRNFISKFVKQ